MNISNFINKYTGKERFWSKVDIKGEDDCWEWKRSLTTEGYGQFGVSGRMIGAHRVAWELTNGLISKGMLILHDCDNKKCCNPKHLYLGTHCNNMTDAVSRGFQGGRQAILNKEKVQRVKDLKGKYSSRRVASLFGVSHMTISNIWKGKGCYA